MVTNKNFLVGMGIGLAAGGLTAVILRPKKRTMKSALGKTLKNMSEMADSISDAMGW